MKIDLNKLPPLKVDLSKLPYVPYYIEISVGMTFEQIGEILLKKRDGVRWNISSL